jgi:hypothetical protein
LMLWTFIASVSSAYDQPNAKLKPNVLLPARNGS